MKDIVLSKRMEAVVDMVSPQSFTIADIGCDHAYVSIALIKRKLAGKVIAMDVRKGPLGIAKKNVAAYAEEQSIELRLSDGLEQLAPGEADSIIIAGMGGLLIKSILEKGNSVLSYKEKRPILILQPQSDLREVRIFLYQNAYHIVQERMLIDEGKYYTVIKAEPDRTESKMTEGNQLIEPESEKSDRGDSDEALFSEVEWVYGRYGLEHQDAILYAFLQKERSTLEAILERLNQQWSLLGNEKIPRKTRERLDAIKEELNRNAEAMLYFANKNTEPKAT